MGFSWVVFYFWVALAFTFTLQLVSFIIWRFYVFFYPIFFIKVNLVILQFYLFQFLNSILMISVSWFCPYRSCDYFQKWMLVILLSIPGLQNVHESRESMNARKCESISMCDEKLICKHDTSLHLYLWYCRWFHQRTMKLSILSLNDRFLVLNISCIIFLNI